METRILHRENVMFPLENLRLAYKYNRVSSRNTYRVHNKRQRKDIRINNVKDVKEKKSKTNK